jgi:tungstate transport system substrate-binding protein
MKRRFLVALSVFLVFLFVLGCKGQKKELVLATTTSTQDSGLLDVLIPEFEKSAGYKVKVIAVGTGEALKMGERGDADVLLVHAPASEEEFMKNGFGKERRKVMHNDFVLLGPSDDPAGVKGLSVIKAFKKIAGKKSAFVSRADNSGTHKKEVKIWALAGTMPSGDWYIQTGQGMGTSLKMASEKRAYILSDRGTYLAMENNLELKVLIEGEELFFNPYHVITVNPEKNPKINYEGAKAFMNFITGKKAQRIIKDFGKDKYGQPLFVPDALKF